MKLNTIYNENCLTTMNNMPNNFIDLVVTSPPYDNLRDYKGYEFEFNKIAKELFRIIKKGGVMVWIVGDATINGTETGTSFKQALFFKEIGFNLHDTMIWKKPNFSNPSLNRYHQTFEYMFILSKGKPKTFNPIKDRKNKYAKGSVGQNSTRQKNGKMKILKNKTNTEYGMRHNVWEIITAGQENFGKHLEHPAMFPQKLVRDHIISWSNINDIVYDPFIGSGTTAKVAKQLNRMYIGSEISKEYIKLNKYE